MRLLISIITSWTLLVLWTPGAGAQVITVKPAFPNAEEPVTIIFNAREGTGGLAGYTGDVYAYTGVITNESPRLDYWGYLKADWDQNTPDTKLERIGTDRYRLYIPDIRAYYSNSPAEPIPESERILRLAFVFRSADGRREGKDLGGAEFGDIFVDLFPPGVHVRLVEPAIGPVEQPRVRVDTVLSVVAVGGAIGAPLAGMNLLVDGEEVAQTTADTLVYTLPYQPGREAALRVYAETTNGETTTIAFDAVFVSRAKPTSTQRPRFQEPTFERVSLGGGTADTRVEDVLQDRRGFLWIGTSNGLYRYDGYTFTAYQRDPDDPNSLSHNTVYAMVEDRRGRLWIGTEKGLNRFDPSTETFAHFLHDPADSTSLSNDRVAAVYEDRDGVLWVGTQAGLDRLDPGTGDSPDRPSFTQYLNDPRSHVLGRVEAIYEDSTGVLWVGTWGDGLSRFDRATETFTHYLHASDNLHSLSNNVVESIYEDRSGRLWIGTAAGLDRFDRERGTFTRFRFETDNSVGLRMVHSIHQEANGMLWIGASGGLHRIDPITGHVTHYRHNANDSNSLRQSDVFKVFADRSEMLWIGTDTGLDKMRKTSFASYHQDQIDPNSRIRGAVQAILEDRAGLLWIGTSEGLHRIDKKSETITFFPYDVLGSHDIFSIFEDQAGSLWVGTYKGLSQFDRQAETFIHYPLNYYDYASTSEQLGLILSRKDMPAVYESPSQPGMLWLGTMTDLFRFEPYRSGEFVHYSLETTHPNAWRRVNTIYEAPSQPGVLWLGTVGGFNKFDMATGQATHYRHDPDDPTSLGGDDVQAIYEDQAGALWVGTRDGLNRFDRDTEIFTRFTTRNGLPDNHVAGILGDDQGHLWISTSNGLSRFDPAILTFKTYDTRDGLMHDFNAGAYHCNRRGELLFGGAEGFIVFHPEDIRDNPHVPPVVLTDFQVFGKSVGLEQPLAFAEELQLLANQNSFSFEFAALDFTAPKQNRYAYRLDGFDKEWVESGTRRFARYPNVPPGAYVFRVRGSNSDGVWNEDGASVRVVITPPFWRTGWFFALCLVFVLSLVTAAGYVVRARRLKAHALELRRMVQERTRELVAEQKKTEAQARKLLELEQAKSRFFANISHEFRTPLTLILGPLHDVLDGIHGPISQATRRHLQVMRRSSTRLHSLIDQLLDLSKLDVGGMDLQAQRHDLIPFLKAIVLSFSSLAERQGVTLQFNAEAETLPLSFDADKLEKVVTNLLSNAFKFTGEGGRVRVSVGEAVDEAGSFAEIRVRDTGQGIPAEVLPHLFDRFYQADTTTREHEGTGIGLALAKELVVLHGGTIRVESEHDFGSLFIVRIPFSGEEGITEEIEVETGYAERSWLDEEGDGLPETLTEEKPVEAPEGAPTILIVEDNADVRDYLKGHLGGRYHVIEAADGVEGLEKTHAETPDLVISDVMMPKMDGVALCRAVKQDEHLNHIPVILLTAKASEEAEVEGLEAGADDYVTKPFRAETLLARAENLIEIRRLLRHRFSGEVVLQPSAVVVMSEEAAFLEQVRAVVEAHLGDANFTVEWLADEVGLSPRQLYRRLRALGQLSPAGLIRMMRLERAAQLLDQQAGRVSEIAYQVGFKDPHYFSRLFHQTFGFSPSEYSTHRT